MTIGPANAELSVRGPFDIKVKLDGQESTFGSNQVDLKLLERLQPVRRPFTKSRSRHMPGKWFSSTNLDHVEYESLLERDWLLKFDFNTTVEFILEQPFRLRFRSGGSWKNHVPDSLLWRDSRPFLMCDVKPLSLVDEGDFPQQMEACKLFSEALGFQYLVLTEPDKQEMDNLRWISGSRFAEAGYADGIEKIRSLLVDGPFTIGELEKSFKPEDNLRPILFRGLWEQALRFDLFAPLSSSTPIWLVDEH